MEMKSKTECPSLIYRLFCEDKINRPAVYDETAVYAHFDSFFTPTYMFGTVYTNTYRCFQLCSSWMKLYIELLFIKQFFLKNGCLENFINVSKSLW